MLSFFLSFKDFKDPVFYVEGALVAEMQCDICEMF